MILAVKLVKLRQCKYYKSEKYNVYTVTIGDTYCRFGRCFFHRSGVEGGRWGVNRAGEGNVSRIYVV